MAAIKTSPRLWKALAMYGLLFLGMARSCSAQTTEDLDVLKGESKALSISQPSDNSISAFQTKSTSDDRNTFASTADPAIDTTPFGLCHDDYFNPDDPQMVQDSDVNAWFRRFFDSRREANSTNILADLVVGELGLRDFECSLYECKMPSCPDIIHHNKIKKKSMALEEIRDLSRKQYFAVLKISHINAHLRRIYEALTALEAHAIAFIESIVNYFKTDEFFDYSAQASCEHAIAVINMSLNIVSQIFSFLNIPFGDIINVSSAIAAVATKGDVEAQSISSMSTGSSRAGSSRAGSNGSGLDKKPLTQWQRNREKIGKGWYRLWTGKSLYYIWNDPFHGLKTIETPLIAKKRRVNIPVSYANGLANQILGVKGVVDAGMATTQAYNKWKHIMSQKSNNEDQVDGEVEDEGMRLDAALDPTDHSTCGSVPTDNRVKDAAMMKEQTSNLIRFWRQQIAQLWDHMVSGTGPDDERDQLPMWLFSSNNTVNPWANLTNRFEFDKKNADAFDHQLLSGFLRNKKCYVKCQIDSDIPLKKDEKVKNRSRPLAEEVCQAHCWGLRVSGNHEDPVYGMNKLEKMNITYSSMIKSSLDRFLKYGNHFQNQGLKLEGNGTFEENGLALPVCRNRRTKITDRKKEDFPCACGDYRALETQQFMRSLYMGNTSAEFQQDRYWDMFKRVCPINIENFPPLSHYLATCGLNNGFRVNSLSHHIQWHTNRDHRCDDIIARTKGLTEQEANMQFCEQKWPEAKELINEQYVVFYTVSNERYLRYNYWNRCNGWMKKKFGDWKWEPENILEVD